MIKGIRVDHRLLHGQVAVSWVSDTNANTVLIANDDVANDEFRKSAMRLAKPKNVKLVMKDIEYSINAINDGITDKYDMFVVVENVKDAYDLITHTKVFNSLNLGGIKARADTTNLSKTVNVTAEDIKLLNDLVDKGIEVEIRQVPSDKKQIYTKL